MDNLAKPRTESFYFWYTGAMINKVISILIVSDFFLQAGWGMIAPIFAIFITQQIQGGTLEMVGLIAGVFWITKSLVQPFLAHFFDVKKGEVDDFKFLVAGMFVANLIPLGYMFATQLSHLLILEFIHGLAMAAVVPAWAGIFTRHISKGWEAFSWSIESTGLGFAAGFAAVGGGILASAFGFQAVFFFVTLFGLTSSVLLLLLKHKIFPRTRITQPMPTHKDKLSH